MSAEIRLPFDPEVAAAYAAQIEEGLQRDLVARARREVALQKKAQRKAKKLARQRHGPQLPKRFYTGKPTTIDVGNDREVRAAEHLIGKGYEIVTRNYRCDVGELDLVARKGDLLVIVEVRSRKNDRFGHAAEMVTVTKQRKVTKVASYYLGATKLDYKRVRFDVIAVTGDVLDHIEDAWRIWR